MTDWLLDAPCRARLLALVSPVQDTPLLRQRLGPVAFREAPVGPPRLAVELSFEWAARRYFTATWGDAEEWRRTRKLYEQARSIGLQPRALSPDAKTATRSLKSLRTKAGALVTALERATRKTSPAGDQLAQALNDWWQCDPDSPALVSDFASLGSLRTPLGAARAVCDALAAVEAVSRKRGHPRDASARYRLACEVARVLDGCGVSVTTTRQHGRSPHDGDLADAMKTILGALVPSVPDLRRDLQAALDYITRLRA